MKSLVWFITVFLLPLELTHATHITIRGQHKRTPTKKPVARTLIRRGGGSCVTSNTINTNTNLTHGSPDPPEDPSNTTTPGNSAGFPSLGFEMPDSVPSSLDGWWSDYTSEIGFLGFSYSVALCQSPDTLKREFKDIRTRFNGRYVRLYGTCDRDRFYEDVVDAAWDAGLGVHALIWFGFEGGSEWMNRRDSLFRTLQNTPKAKFVTRAVQFGSEPLFDGVLSPDELASNVIKAKEDLASLGILLTVSDMAFGYKSNGGAQSVLDAIDFVDLHMLPYFTPGATTVNHSWGFIESDLDWINTHAGGKKIILSENGWPWKDTPTTHSDTALASVDEAESYFKLLDSKCAYFKKNPGGGIGWFAHLYSEEQGEGYGILDNGKLRFPFSPDTSC